MSKRPVILDCDTGLDDAFAIAMAIASDELDVKGVTTVAGNYTLPDVILNTKRALSVTDPSVPYAIGADKPIRVPLRTHGRETTMFENLGNPDIEADSLSAVEFMAKIIKESDVPVTLVPLGPLTNIAILLLAYPELKEKIDEVVIMGGSVFSGNTTPTAEFNILVDPEAAHIVFKAGLKLVMCGLEVCEYARISREHGESLIALGNQTAVQYGEELIKGLGEGESIIFDAVPIVYLLKPEIIETKDCFVVVDIDGENTVGCTATDMRMRFRPEDMKEPNTKVALKMDKEAFGEVLLDLFKKYN